MRVVLLCRYDGSNYHGFQIQPNNNTIQEEIEKSLKKINKKDVRLYMSGRTDSGVHAYGQVLHFDTDLNIPDEAWVKALNATIPKDIRIVGRRQLRKIFMLGIIVHKKHIIINFILEEKWIHSY